MTFLNILLCDREMTGHGHFIFLNVGFIRSDGVSITFLIMLLCVRDHARSWAFHVSDCWLCSFWYLIDVTLQSGRVTNTWLGISLFHIYLPFYVFACYNCMLLKLKR